MMSSNINPVASPVGRLMRVFNKSAVQQHADSSCPGYGEPGAPGLGVFRKDALTADELALACSCRPGDMFIAVELMIFCQVPKQNLLRTFLAVLNGGRRNTEGVGNGNGIIRDHFTRIRPGGECNVRGYTILRGCNSTRWTRVLRRRK